MAYHHRNILMNANITFAQNDFKNFVFATVMSSDFKEKNPKLFFLLS
jgi:hypothetical protein